MSFHVTMLTLFPESFPGILGTSIIGRGLKEGAWSLDCVNIRDFGLGKHKDVDDTPAAGGAGMVLRPDVLANAIDSVPLNGRPLVYLSPRGKPLKQSRVRELAQGPGLVLLSGRFEGVDERILKARNIEEVSLGDFVLAGGEVAAMALTEACVRLLPGVLGAPASSEEESFEDGLLEYPHYTKPREFEGMAIPEVLLSGDHKKIADWRRQKALEITRARRPDLLMAGSNPATNDKE